MSNGRIVTIELEECSCADEQNAQKEEDVNTHTDIDGPDHNLLDLGRYRLTVYGF